MNAHSLADILARVAPAQAHSSGAPHVLGGHAPAAQAREQAELSDRPLVVLQMSNSAFLRSVTTPVAAALRRKGLFKGSYILFCDYLHAGQSCFEHGLAIGHLCRDRLPLLIELIWPGQNPEKARAALAESAAAQVERLSMPAPDLFQLFFQPEAEALMKKLKMRRRSLEWSEYPKVVRYKLPERDTLPLLEFAIAKGIALGSQRPEVAERACEASPSPELWSVAREGCRDLPAAPPQPSTLADRHNQAGHSLRAYLEEVRPDLLCRLGLWPRLANDVQLRLKALLARHGNTLE